MLFVCLLASVSLSGADLTLTVGGKVSIELRFANADARNFMSLVAPAQAGIAYMQVPDPNNFPGTIALPLSGCRNNNLAVANALPGIALITEVLPQYGCRIQLDANRYTPDIDPFPAGTVLRFALCSIQPIDLGTAGNVVKPANGVPSVCDYIWSSNPDLNNGKPPYSNDPFRMEHLRIVPNTNPAYAGRIYDLGWEDQVYFRGDRGFSADFDDLVARVTVDLDSDGDGLWDDWEDSGIDTNGDGSPDLILGTDKYRKDLFLRLDYMDCSVGSAPGDTSCTNLPGHNHALNPIAKAQLEAAFLAAPVSNPMGRPNGIVLHLTPGIAVTHSDRGNIPGRCSTPPFNNYPQQGNFDLVKAVAFPASDFRRFTHRYGLLAHNLGSSGVTGCSELPGNDFIVTLGNYLPDTPARITQQASTVMHELGHTLGLQHGGDEPVNGKPNYLSVMNYNFQLSAVPQINNAPPKLDYSAGLSIPLEETSLDESRGIGLTTSTSMTGFFCAKSGAKTFTSRQAAGGIDWNCSGIAPVGNVGGIASGDINGDRYCVERGGAELATTIGSDDQPIALGTWISDGPNRICDSAASPPDYQLRRPNNSQPGQLTDYNDWANLLFAFQTSPDYGQGVHITGIPDLELDLRDYLRFLGPQPSITKTASVSGLTVTYTIRVTNDSTAETEDLVVTDVLPPRLSFISCTSTTGGVCGGAGNARTISFARLGGGQTATITIIASLNCPATPTSIVNTAAIRSSSPDRNGGDNSAEGSITALPVGPGCSVSTLPVSINRSVVTQNRTTGLFSQTVILTNLGPVNLPATAYVLDHLSAGVTVLAPTGTTSAALPAGSPYKEVGPIGRGASVEFTVEFSRPGTQAINYVPRVLGPGPR
jgi:uncharacterized repeat protein (TIGR01451 family)